MAYPERPTLSDDGHSYLLWIHPKDRERAKSIGQQRWDPARQSWVYPRNERIYDALVAEFGDDLDASRVKRLAARPPEENLEAGSANRRVASGSPDAPSQRAATASVDDFVELKVQIKTLERQSKALEEALATARQDAEIARSMAKRLEDAMAAENASDRIDKLVKEIALEAAEQDGEFATLLARVEISDMPIALARRLEEECRRVLRVDDERVALADLLAELRDTVLLSGDAIDLAHVVRKQRNIMAHEERAKGQRKARALVALMATSLLWPELKRARDTAGG